MDSIGEWYEKEKNQVYPEGYKKKERV